jgi:UDPglucose--hexose-1-phosphate uridylyltransferase
MEAVTPAELETCPFCEGREDRTPPETFALGPDGRRPDTPGWRVRVVPNKYPAFERHEVVIHTPQHTRSIAELTDEEAALVVEAWRARDLPLRSGGFDHLVAVINEGRDAGASLGHSHSQLVALSEQPPIVATEAAADVVGIERADGVRVVLERDGVVLLCPEASRVPYELFVAPIAPDRDPLASALQAPAVGLLAEGLRRIHAIEGPVPMNAWLHDQGSSWHWELVPRLTIPASLELGAGVYVNTLAPEEAAERLRNAVT